MAEKIEIIRRKKTMNLSFSGCGFLCIYHAGVGAAIREYAPELALNIVSGASAGTIAAAGLLCNVGLGQATSDILKVVIRARSHLLSALSPNFKLIELVRDGLHQTLPANAHQMCTGRLRVSLTRFADGENVVVSEFSTKDELIQAIVCSCFIPFYCGSVPPSYRGVRYIDGGWSDNQPSLDSDTITVSPFSGESDICPPDWDSSSFFGMGISGTSIRFTSRNLFRMSAVLFPPHPEVCSRMCRQGFQDTLRFLAKNGLLSCTRCVTIRSCITLPAASTSIEEEDGEENRVSALPQKSPEGPMASSSPRYATYRHRNESDCELCQETTKSVHRNQITLPHLVQKTLADAEAAERSIIAYILGSRMFKLARLLSLPWILPIELTLAACKCMYSWMPSVTDAQWLVDRSTRALTFVMREIEKQQSLYSARFACQLAITETNYTCPAEHMPSPESPSWNDSDTNFGFSVDLGAQSRPVRKMAELRRRDSYSVHNRGPQASEYAQAARSMEWEGYNKAATGGGDIAQHEHLEHEHQHEEGQQEEFDTFARVLEYTKRHDSILAYYYLDRDNKVKVCEIFDVANNEEEEDETSGSSVTSSTRKNLQSPQRGLNTTVYGRESPIIEQNDDDEDHDDVEVINEVINEDEVAIEDNFSVERGDGLPVADSGLSLTEEDIIAVTSANDNNQECSCEDRKISPNSMMKSGRKRDACCSPVRDFAPQKKTDSAACSASVRSLPVAVERASSVNGPANTMSSLRGAGGVSRFSRRPTHPPYKRLSGPPNLHTHSVVPNVTTDKITATTSLISSDSDADAGEKFFVPDRRKSGNSLNYDGDPEPSDTEEGL